MPRYYFNYRVAESYMEDGEGSDLPDLEAARLEAIENARHLMAAAVHEGRDISHRIYEICSEDGQVLLRVPFAGVISKQD